MIRSRPYNPKSQGKVERSHRVLRRKIYYDLVQQKKAGINWVKNLLSCLNLEKRDKLGWKSPFEIYFGRNELLSEGQNCDGTVDIFEYIRPFAKDDQDQRKTKGERQRDLTIKLLEKCWIVMHIEKYTSYINVVIRCLFDLPQKNVD